MGKPTSSLTTAISIRIPNDLLEAINTHAQAAGLINASGRMDKRGQPNLSAAISDLLRQALERSDAPTSSRVLSDSVSSDREKDLEAKFTSLEDRLAAKVSAAIAHRLDVLFANHTPPNQSEEDASSTLHPAPEPSATPLQPEIHPNAKEDTRARILKAVNRGFRSRGYSGIGVDALAKEAGVTSGAFYGYFRSKEEAFLAAVVEGLSEYRLGIEAFRAAHGADWVVALADYYVGHQHRENLACGCALPTLSPEVVRSNGRIRAAYQTELLKLHAAIAAGLTTGTISEKQNIAWVILSVLAGGVTLARAVLEESVAQQIANAVHQATVAIASWNFTAETQRTQSSPTRIS